MKKQSTEANLKDNAPEGIALSDAEVAAARKEGAKEDVKEAAKDTHRMLTDGNLPGEAPSQRWLGHDEIMQWEPLLDLSPDAFEKRINSKDDAAVPEEKIYGLLGLERNGRNRTDYVRPMMKRLGLKAGELPGGGPAYTNDTTPISAL